MSANRYLAPIGIALVGFALCWVPAIGLPAFYDSFLYLIFYWVALATSWSILSGYAGYFSFASGAFFGAGMYTTATLAGKFSVPFLWTLPAAALIAALLGTGIGAVVFRLKRLRGELFALLTIAVSFVLATIILNTGIDGGSGVFLSGVPLPRIVASPTGTIYLLGLALAVSSVAVAYWVTHSRLGIGLFAIHDDEDVAEVKGVPTFRYKLLALALSAGIAGTAGGVHAMYVGFVTVNETFSITVPLYVVLMSVLGGARHWLGPAVGATLIAASLYAFTSGEQAMLGRAAVAFAMILTILLLPDGVVPTCLRWWRKTRDRTSEGTVSETERPVVALAAGQSSDQVILRIGDVTKSFGGIQALRGVTLDVRRGEILGLVGPNGSGKTTLINLITGHFRRSGGTIALDGMRIDALPAHQVARHGVARTYQIPRPFMQLTVLDNLMLSAGFGGAPMTRQATLDEAHHWLRFTGLATKAMALPGELNLHERKFLELARALVARPRLLLLDEVLSGLNPSEVDSAIALIREIRARGATILFVEHVMRAVVELSDRIAVLNEGTLFALGTPREVMRDPRVVSVYLGKAHAA